MAVPEGKRSEPKMKVQTKAIELAKYSDNLCSNEKYFPKRRRWTVANRIVNYAFDIMDCINAANKIYVSTKEDFCLRREYQTQAISCTGKLLGQIDLAYSSDKYSLKGQSVAYWTGLILDVETLLRKWRNSDMERYGSLE